MPLLLLFFSAFAVMAALTLAERTGRRGQTEWVRNLQVYAVDFSVALLTIGYIPVWMGGSLLDAATLPAWVAFPVFLLVRDFTEWLYHFAQHRLPWLWAMHSLHHCDREMTALTANRHFWGDHLIKSVTVWTMSAMVIQPTPGLFAGYGVVTLYHYFSHANLRIDFGRWSWLINSPAYHRRHHSRLPEHHGTNFAALFPIFDVIFGTYRRPDGWPPCGLDDAAARSFADVVFWPVRRKLADRAAAAPVRPREISEA